MTPKHFCPDNSSPYDSPLFAVLTLRADITDGDNPLLPIALADEIQHLSGANVRQLCQMLHIPQGSFYSLKRQNAFLSMQQSVRLLRIAGILRRSYELFHEPALVVQWLKQPSWDLDGHSPWEMLSTEGGLHEVDSILASLENGGRSVPIAD